MHINTILKSIRKCSVRMYVYMVNVKVLVNVAIFHYENLPMQY